MYKYAINHIKNKNLAVSLQTKIFTFSTIFNLSITIEKNTQIRGFIKKINIKDVSNTYR